MKNIILIISIFLIGFYADASEIDILFKAKKYSSIVKQYNSPAKLEALSPRQTLLVSYAYKALRLYRDDARLIAGLIKRIHARDHQKLYVQIEKKESIDSDDYPKSLKMLYWNIYTDYAQIILTNKKRTPLHEKDLKIFQSFRTILSELEYREGKVEKLNDQVISHDQYLKDLVYNFTKNFSITYMSWQASANLIRTTNNNTTKLLVTNTGTCIGGDIGYENGFNHFAVDACLFFGGGTANSIDNQIVQYKQDIGAYGLKIGPTYSRIISSSRTRLGASLAIVYNTQAFTDPDDEEYVVEGKSSISLHPSIFARWQFDKWFFKSEFGGFIGQDEVVWGLGIGRSF